MKDDRPNLWIYYHARFRSPGSTHLYKWMKANSKLFKTTLITDTAKGVTAEEVCKRWKIPMPDIVLDGFGGYVGCLKSFDDFQKHGTKIIRTVADVEVHKGDFGGGHHEHNTDMYVDALYFPVSPRCYPAIDRLNEYREDLPTQRDAELICIPFGVSTERFYPIEKSIDVSALYLAEPQNMFHANRIMMNKVLEGWSNEFNKGVIQYRTFVEGKDENTLDGKEREMSRLFKGKHPIGTVMGTDFYKYASYLRRTVIGLADTSKRDYMTNKYLEIGACGAMVLGEQPVGYDDLLNKDTMCSIDMEYVGRDIPQMLDYYLFDKAGVDERKKKVRKLSDLITDGYTLEKWSDKLEAEFVKLLD